MQSYATSFDLTAGTWDMQALPPLDSARTLVLAFGAPELVDQPAVIEALAKSYPRSLLVGCSSAGEIHDTSVRDRSLAVSITRFEHTDLQLAALEVASPADSFITGSKLAKRLVAKPGLRGVLVLSEGLGVNGSELVRGLNSVLDESIVVTGGLSGDGSRFARTWLAIGAKVRSNMVAAVGFYGDHVVIGHGSQGGWDKFGPERVVTRAAGNVLFELDGRPALQLYKQYLGDKAKDLPASGLLFPLAVRASERADHVVVRTLLAVDHAQSSLTFAGDIPQGGFAQLMKADFDRLVDGAGAAATMVASNGPASPHADALVLAISCVGRRLVLGARAEEEIEAVKDAMRSDRARVTGFYSYGEISPHGGKGRCDLHNQTMTVTVFSESAPGATRRPQAVVETSAEDTNTAITVPPRREAATRAAVLGKPALPPTPARGTTRTGNLERALVPAGFVVRDASYDLKQRTWSAPLPALDSPRTLVLGFGAAELVDDPEVFAELVRQYPSAVVVGCSSAGEIHGTGVRDGSLALSITRFEKTELQLASMEVRSPGESFGTGAQLAKRLVARPGLRGVLVLSEGLGVNGSELVRGFNSVLDERVVVTGGLSGDGSRFQRTWVAVGATVRSNVVAAVGLYGDHVTIGHGSQGGWDKFGPERVVTRAEGNVLFELDGKPALQLYKEYLGSKAKDLPASGLLFPLALRATARDDKFVVRTLLSVDPAQQSMTFAGDLPRGHLAQLMKADFERLIDGAGRAGTLSSATGAPPANTDALVIAVSCVGRRLVLGARIEDELEALHEALHLPRAHVTGFYSYGEISPYATGHCDLHNQTMTVTVLSESPTAIGKARGSAPKLATAAAVAVAVPPMPMPVPAPVGPIVRIPRALGTEATHEITRHAGLQVVRLRGRITEAFQGDALGRQLAGRVMFDLADVDRVTSFGVREWLAMLNAASAVTELYFARCSESIANQLAMIRKFAGTAHVVSCFAPYLCAACNNPLERLLDFERDGAELVARAPLPVRCARCDGEARFDDDARTYFSFATASVGQPCPVDVRAIQDALAAEVTAPVIDEVEKLVEGETTRIRVNGKLTAQVRWRKILDGIEGALVIDLGATPASDAAGIHNLEQALRALPPEVKPLDVEAAPTGLVERVLQGGNRRVRIVSAVVTGYCDACAVNRPAIVRVDQYATDAAKGTAHQVLCKRCNGALALTVDRSFEKIVEIHQRPAKVAARVAPDVPGVMPPAARRSWLAVGAVGVLAVAVVGLGTLLYLNQRAQAAAPLPAVVAAPVVAPAPPPPAVPDGSAGWQATVDLPPAWTERPFAIEGETVLVVGHGSDLEAARAGAIRELVDRAFGELARTKLHAFVARRMRLDAPGATAAIAHRFAEQHGAEITFERADVARRERAGAAETYARYRLPRAQYTRLVAGYHAATTFRGLEVAPVFPLLETALPAAGPLVVIGVDKRSPADTAGLRDGDFVLAVGNRPVRTVDELARALRAAWANLEPRRALTIEVETAGAPRTVQMYKPAPQP